MGGLAENGWLDIGAVYHEHSNITEMLFAFARECCLSP